MATINKRSFITNYFQTVNHFKQPQFVPSSIDQLDINAIASNRNLPSLPYIKAHQQNPPPKSNLPWSGIVNNTNDVNLKIVTNQ